jgi:hypothetical protein
VPRRRLSEIRVRKAWRSSKALICALGTPQAESSRATAEAVIQGPDAMSLVECGLHGQAYIAYDAIADYLDGEHYLKIQLHGGRTVASAEPIQTARRSPRAPHAIPCSATAARLIRKCRGWAGASPCR